MVFRRYGGEQAVYQLLLGRYDLVKQPAALLGEEEVLGATLLATGAPTCANKSNCPTLNP